MCCIQSGSYCITHHYFVLTACMYLGELQHVAITDVSRLAGASHARILLHPAEDQGAIRYVQ